MVQTSSGRTGSFRSARVRWLSASSAVLASAVVPASSSTYSRRLVYGSPRSPRVSAGSSAADSRTVAGSQPTRAAALANADRRPFAADTGMSPDVPLLARRRVAPKPRLPSASLLLPASASAGLPLFCDHRLQRSFVQQQFGHGVLQLPVFRLQCRASGPRSPPSPEFRLPAVKPPPRDPWARPNSSGAIPASASLISDDLFFVKSTLAHDSSSLALSGPS